MRQKLPLAAREWIVLLDDLERVGGWGRVLRDAWGLEKVPDCAAFSLLRAGEDDRRWGPPLRDLALEDPPTYGPLRWTELVAPATRSSRAAGLRRLRSGCRTAVARARVGGRRTHDRRGSITRTNRSSRG